MLGWVTVSCWDECQYYQLHISTVINYFWPFRADKKLWEGWGLHQIVGRGGGDGTGVCWVWAVTGESSLA